MDSSTDSSVEPTYLQPGEVSVCLDSSACETDQESHSDSDSLTWKWIAWPLINKHHFLLVKEYLQYWNPKNSFRLLHPIYCCKETRKAPDE